MKVGDDTDGAFPGLPASDATSCLNTGKASSASLKCKKSNSDKVQASWQRNIMHLLTLLMDQYQWFPKMRNLHYQYLHDDDEKANAIW